MVYCTACGVKNEDEAKICVSCEKPIYHPSGFAGRQAQGQRAIRFGEMERRGDNTGLISFGIFLALLGIILAYTPNLIFETRSFFQDLHLVQLTPDIYLPAPSTAHPVFYLAAAKFCAMFGITQISILFLEFIQNLSIHRKAETVSGIVLWIGSGYLVNLLSTESILWFQFWVMLIILIGFSLIMRGVVMASPGTV